MAQEQLQSNILLLTNIGAESQYKVFIKYSYNFDGSGDLYDSPPTGGGTIYIGIYIGTEGSNPTASDYTWSQYNGQPGENNYIDIRYGNYLDSGKIILTSDANEVQNGKDSKNASLMGVLVTNNAIVMDQNWYPEKEGDNSGIEIEDYTWSEINAGGVDAIYYDLKLYSDESMANEVVNIKKFFIADADDDYSLQYSPSKIYLKLIRVVGSSSEEFQYSSCTYVKKYIGGTDSGEITFVSTSTDDPCIDLTSEKEEIAYININFKDSTGTTFFTSLKEVTFLTNAEMAKLSVEATNITLAVKDNKVIFGEDGLTVKNTSFKIVKDIKATTEDGQDTQEVLLEANTAGDLAIKGIITAQGGKIGNWNIDNNGLITDDGNIGLYGNVQDANNPNPILLWAGKSNEADISYNFSIAKNGDVRIEGEVVATSGRILDTFYVGKNNTGITIFGGSEEKGKNCYISTSNFASGSLGYGWKLSQDGTAEFSNIIARGKIQSSVFEHNKISSVGGSLYIAPTIYIENESIGISKKEGDQTHYYVTWNSIPYASSKVDNNTKEQNIDGQETGETAEEGAIYYLEDINGSNWYIGDQLKIDGIVIKNNTADSGEEKIELSNLDAYIENIQPDGAKSNVTIKFSLSDRNFKIDENNLYYFLPGTILIWHGRDGLQQGLYLTASSKNGPFMDVYNSSPNEENMSPMVRLGNLSGISDINFGDTLSGYGLYTSNAYLRGQLMLPGAGITNQNAKTYGEGDNNSPIRIWAGVDSTDITKADITKANFIVTENGYMYAKQGIFEGTVVATNSEFSGSIRAAGILLEEDAGTATDVNHDHFYVAYNKIENNQQILSPLTYLLNIDKNGLSIWEGGLRAYSDRASEINNLIYGYSESNENPLPFFFLVDDIYENENEKILNSRIVAYKGHFLQIEKEENATSYSSNSVVIDKGIWFYQSEIENVSETSVFQTAIGSKKSGIELINKNNILQMQSKNINLLVDNEQAVYICATEGDIINRQEKLFIRGSVRVDNDEENLISLGGVSLKEIKIKDNDDKTKTIGLDFIIK